MHRAMDFRRQTAIALALLAAWGAFTVLPAQEEAPSLPALLVLSQRGTGADSPALAEWSGEEMRREAPRTLDAMLAREPSFSLFRRQTSLFGNPTASGVSLRNTGATAASRTLVLLDGIPQNDPFGGWVNWNRYDTASLESVRIAPARESAVWGNMSPAGVVLMDKPSPFDAYHHLKLGGGGQGTVSGAGSHQFVDAQKNRSVSFAAFGLHTDGFYALDPSQRGAIDRKLSADLWGCDLQGAWLAAPGLIVQPGVSIYSEERGNGTQLSRNATDAVDFTFRVTSQEASSSWQAALWHQMREFESVFSAASDDRSTETIALDQFDVPARGTGASFVWNGETRNRIPLIAGADLRVLDGETNEDAGTFRRRSAGGSQALAGAFVTASAEPDPSTELDASLRVDAWSINDGKRRETSLVDGSPLRADTPPDRRGWEPSASAGVTRKLPANLSANLAAGTAFRAPTLNELHRPFRVRDDVTEANPQLDPERFLSLEGGLSWKPSDTLGISLSLFQHLIRDAIANVPVTNPADIAAITGGPPIPGLSYSQRRNVEEARSAGIETGLSWQPDASWNLSLRGLWSDTEFTDSPGQPLLEGKPFPQAPELRIVADAGWTPIGDVTLFAGWEYGSRQFDDALAARSIPDYHSARIGVAWKIGKALCQVRVDNLFDEEIQTGLGSDGIRTYAAPRSVWAGVDWRF
jgi:outer membrane receptor protein involved in Fe transport